MRRVARRQLGLFGLLLVLLWLVGVRGYSDYLARVLPERALALNPSQPEALLRAADDVIVVVGGVVPRQDYQFLLDHGVSAVFGPGTNVLDAARAVLDLLEGKRRNA